MNSEPFENWADRISAAAGRPIVWFVCFTLVLVWAASGPFLHFSDTWQLFINTTTTIITFLMVFLIQSTHNRDTKAIQVKLDELLRSIEGTRPEFIGVEDESERVMDGKKASLKTQK